MHANSPPTAFITGFLADVSCRVLVSALLGPGPTVLPAARAAHWEQSGAVVRGRSPAERLWGQAYKARWACRHV